MGRATVRRTGVWESLNDSFRPVPHALPLAAATGGSRVSHVDHS